MKIAKLTKSGSLDARKRQQAESRRGLHPSLDVLLPTLLDPAFKGDL